MLKYCLKRVHKMPKNADTSSFYHSKNQIFSMIFEFLFMKSDTVPNFSFIGQLNQKVIRPPPQSTEAQKAQSW